MNTNLQSQKGTIVLRMSLVTLTLLLNACSLSGSTLWGSSAEDKTSLPVQPETQAAPTTKVAIQDLAANKAASLSDIEILWKIPENQVDGFVLKYGYIKENLDQETKVATKDLEKYEDPKYGFVYRYVLNGVPVEKTLYVSIAAYNGEKVSKPSQTIVVPPENFPAK